ncbi:cation channel sperm-associated protein 3-like [Aplochiton taeniatus]
METTADELFLSIYASEFLMKVYVQPVLYWRNGYNLFDATILVFTFIPFISIAQHGNLSGKMHIIKACSCMRVLRTVSFIRGLQALTQALFKTMKSVVYVLGLMFLLMFLFAIIGFYYFGDPITGDPDNWGDLGNALFTLFSLVTVDGWTDLQKNLDDLGIASSRIFTIVFILIGYFIFFNMFIGVVIIEIHHATKRYETEVQTEREQSLSLKKQAIIQRQNEEIRKLIHSQTGNDCNFYKLVEQFKKSLRHSDYMMTEDLCTSMPFVDIYLTTLDHQDNTLNKLQNLYSEVMVILGELLESDILEEQEQKAKEKKLKNWRK